MLFQGSRLEEQLLVLLFWWLLIPEYPPPLKLWLFLFFWKPLLASGEDELQIGILEFLLGWIHWYHDYLAQLPEHTATRCINTFIFTSINKSSPAGHIRWPRAQHCLQARQSPDGCIGNVNTWDNTDFVGFYFYLSSTFIFSEIKTKTLKILLCHTEKLGKSI